MNSREKLINGDIRAIRIKIRREHVLRVGVGMRASTITLGEAYAYGLSTFYSTYTGGKYHLAANCSSLGMSAPQSYWGIQLDSEVITHGTFTICGACAGRNDEYDTY